MKKTRAEILALFNRSTSGKSFINIADGIMFIITLALYEMVKSNDVVEVEFVEDGGTLDLTATDGTVSKVKTAKVKTFTESRLVKLRTANEFIAEASKFDEAAYAAAMKKMEGVVI